MNKHKILALILALSFCFSVASCTSSGSSASGSGSSTGGGTSNTASSEDENLNENTVSILKDKKFRQGFVVRGLGKPIYGDDIEYFGEMYDPMCYFNYGLSNLNPSWRLCQWASRYPFHDKENTTYEYKNGVKTYNYKFTDKGNGIYKYDNQSKTVEMNTKTGEFRLALKGSECYKMVRTAGQEWPHLLFEQYLCTSSDFVPETKISDSESIRVKLDVKLNSFTDNMGADADPSLHSAMCLFYIFVANYDKDTNAFTDMLWFGVQVFDNRYAYIPEMSFPDSGSKESATDKWIFNIASSEFFNPDNNLYDENGNRIFGAWKSVDVELISLIRRAFGEARNAGYMANSSWENLYVNGMYMGYELPGNYDLDMSFRNIDILVEKSK